MYLMYLNQLLIKINRKTACRPWERYVMFSVAPLKRHTTFVHYRPQ